jgi:hypothetical protein
VKDKWGNSWFIPELLPIDSCFKLKLFYAAVCFRIS